MNVKRYAIQRSHLTDSRFEWEQAKTDKAWAPVVLASDYDALAARLAELERAGMPEVLRGIQTQSDLVKRLDARLAKAESALREAVDYLDYHDGLNSICADSILHRKMRAAIASATSSAAEGLPK